MVRQTRIRIFAGDTKSPEKDRKCVRTAHGNYSQRESEQAQRVWQAGQDPRSGKPNRDPTLSCMPSALRTRLYCCPRSRCTNRDWDESRAWWPPMPDFIRARTRRRDKHSGCSGCRCPTRTARVASGNFFSTSVGFPEGKNGEPGRRAESVCSNEDTGYDVATIPGWTAGAVGSGWA